MGLELLLLPNNEKQPSPEFATPHTPPPPQDREQTTHSEERGREGGEG